MWNLNLETIPHPISFSLFNFPSLSPLLLYINVCIVFDKEEEEEEEERED